MISQLAFPTRHVCQSRNGTQPPSITEYHLGIKTSRHGRVCREGLAAVHASTLRYTQTPQASCFQTRHYVNNGFDNMPLGCGAEFVVDSCRKAGTVIPD